MVLRHDRDGVLAVGQPSHAWLCGQFARAWGNQRFGDVSPLAEVVLGAEQHDIGMARSDLEPTRNPHTGLPHSFLDMGIERNVAMWRTGPSQLIAQSRYAALLAAMHGRRLYERRDPGQLKAAEAELVADLLERSRALEATLLDALRADPETAPAAGAWHVARNSDLIWTWDTLSLALLLDWAPRTLERVPAAGRAAVSVVLEPAGVTGGIPRTALTPWPFADAGGLRVHCEGRRLPRGGFDTEAALADGFAGARWETATFELVPG